jgi:hypothetical protein
LTFSERADRARDLIDRAPTHPTISFQEADDHFSCAGELPEVHRSELTVNLLASGLQHHGSMVVRELLSPDDVADLRAYVAKGTLRIEDDSSPTPEMDRMISALGAAYRSQGFFDLVERYLGEPPIGVANRTVVKRNEPSPGLPWHQDASFFGGPCASLDAWTALTECGRDCPSLSVVPLRIERVIDPAQTSVAPSAVVEASVAELLLGSEPAKPILQPGDAILLDEMTVHRTGSGWKAPSRDVAITWFFAPSRLPPRQTTAIAF